MNDIDFEDTRQTFARHVNAPYVGFLERMGLAREFIRAEGAMVYDSQDRPFVDCIAGYGNLNLGHNPPKVIEATIRELQSARPFNWPFLAEVHARLAERLARTAPTGLDCSLIVNSGAEAVDSALKLARLVTGKPGIVATRGAWHGFTFGALSVSEPTMRRSFEPLLAGVTQVPYGDAPAAEDAMSASTGAMIVEPIQAESGAVVPPDGYLRELAEICRKRKVLLIFDEIKTGMGKTGRLYACEHEGAVPDILLVGKSLGGGAMPIGALIAKRELWGTFGYSFGMSSSSGAGNAPACAAALAALETLENDRLCENAHCRGGELAQGLRTIHSKFPDLITGFSGRGLLAALHTRNLKTATEIVQECVQEGVLMMSAFCDKSRILIEPPLCITAGQMATVLGALEKAMHRITSN